jgi:hypothetical protein
MLPLVARNDGKKGEGHNDILSVITRNTPPPSLRGALATKQFTPFPSLRGKSKATDEAIHITYKRYKYLNLQKLKQSNLKNRLFYVFLDCRAYACSDGTRTIIL